MVRSTCATAGGFGCRHRSAVRPHFRWWWTARCWTRLLPRIRMKMIGYRRAASRPVATQRYRGLGRRKSPSLRFVKGAENLYQAVLVGRKHILVLTPAELCYQGSASAAGNAHSSRRTGKNVRRASRAICHSLRKKRQPAPSWVALERIGMKNAHVLTRSSISSFQIPASLSW
jgi:hypothetical protein